MPMTYSRAATAIVQCRSHVERARAEMALALQILAGLDGSPAELRSSAQAVPVGRLAEVLARLEEAGRELMQALRSSDG